jgi:hypothetical protein
MFGHLYPGDLVTHIDDVFVGDNDGTWERYLGGDIVGDAGRGWCVDRTTYTGEFELFCHVSCTPATRGE